MPVLDVYAGPLHVGLDAASFSEVGHERAGRSLVLTSVLWGILRPADRIPPYRMHPCSRLVGIDDLQPAWRAVIGDPRAEAAGPAGIVVDLRSPSLQAIGMPTGCGDRTVTLRVDQGNSGGGRIGDVVAKRIRGQAAHLLLETDADPTDPDDLAGILVARWPVRLTEPDRPGRPGSLTLFATD